MTDKAISPLRRRMIEDMTIRKLGPKTQAGYIRAVKNFAAFLGHSPDRASIEDIRRYQLKLASSGLGIPSVNAAMTALRFFFKVTLRRGNVTEDIVFAREPRRLPVVLSPDEVARLLACRPGFFLPVRVLSRLFRRLFLEQITTAYHDGQLQFFGNQVALADPKTFTGHLAPLRRTEWVVYAKQPFAGPEAVLAYLSRYTHRVAIANSRLTAFNDAGVTFKWKDYRAKQHQRGKLMTLAVDEFIRRFLIHVLPSGFHRIRHYGLFANGGRAENIARARQLLHVPQPPQKPDDTDCADAGEVQPSAFPCPCCGGRMIVIETFGRGCTPRHQPTQRIRIDSS